MTNTVEKKTILFLLIYSLKLTASRWVWAIQKKIWRAYKTQHGIKSRLHELRHVLISVSKIKMPEELLKLVVGHTANTDIFGIYGHAVEGDLERAANIFDSIFDKLLK